MLTTEEVPVVTATTISVTPTARVNNRPAVPVLGRATQSSKMNWPSTVVFTLFHVGAIAALFFFTWKALFLSIALYVMAINIGIGMCYHRLLTHRGYRVPKWIEYIMTAFACLALEGGPMFWVATHRVHHQLSDKPGDPHTPHEGAWWAHIGWIMMGDALGHETALLARYAPDLAKDKFHRIITKFHYVPLIIAAVALYFLAGWSGVLWGIFLRVTLGLHATWLVNSATHMWGTKRFPTRDDSRNNWWVALMTGGEGWHNNHHAHPVSARHGLAWYEVDANYYGIWLLKKLGLACDVKIAEYDKADPRPAGV
jgi:stearoyl-CoA desaturase (delta-9 desaturase)